MKRFLHYQIEASQEGETIYQFLKQRGYSRHIFMHLKNAEGAVLKNGAPVFLSERLRPGDRLQITITEESGSENIVASPLPLDIVYEDEDLLIVNKAADMPIHPSINNFDNTLANAIAYYYQQKGESFVYRCINRLDRDTTGLLIIAKNMLSGAVLSEMGKRREIHREYLALADGATPAEGTIDAPIARREGSVLERCVDFAHGERAVTHYRRLAYENGYSLLSLQLETGRTHQIRVHLKYLGYPLIGDFLYNPDYRVMKHQALHSHRLSFMHPVTGKSMKFDAPPSWPWMPGQFV